MTLIEITEKTHDVILDLRYASDNNFTHQKIYDNARCFLHEKAMAPFEKAIILANEQKLKLKIFDTFRPHAAQEKFWSICPDPMYLSPPEKGSPHTRGIAIDLTLVDESGKELDMGTPFDDFTELSHHGAKTPPQAASHRYTLLGIMMSAGWDLYINEWWHYQLFDAKSYPLISDSYGMMT